jgi:hypothetical protein
MSGSKSRPGHGVWSFLLAAAACLPSGAALAAACCTVSTTSAVPMTHFFVWQPVDVCTDAGTSCAYINNNLQTILSAPYNCVANGVNTKCANLNVGWIDPGTGMIAHRNIWSAVGLDFRQTPVVQYNSTASQTLKIDSCTSGTTGCKSSAFSALAQQPAISTMTNPPTSPNVPTFPRSSGPTNINAFFVKNICSTTNATCTTASPRGDLDGFGALNGNAMAIANLVFLPATTGRPDTPGHEGGHAFDLDHTTFGAGGSTNLMTAGGSRMIPIPTNVPQSSPVTAQWVLEESPNATPSSALDLLTPGTAGDGTQQGQALLSGFLNATPAASALICPTFGCGEDAAVQTAAAASPSSPTEFQIQQGFSDDCFNSSVCANVSLAEVDLVLTQGKFDNSSGHSFQVSYPCANASPCSTSPVLAAAPIISHGNNGNEACQDLGPGTWCLTLKFVPGAFTLNNGGFLDFTIGTKPADTSQLAGTVCYFWERAPGVPYYSSCADFSPSFGLFSDSQKVNLALNPLIPLGFVGTGAGPCTGSPCPDPTSSYTQDNDSVERSEPQSGKR